MRFKINGKEHQIPSSLREVTLKQKIDFHNFHGIELGLMQDSIEQIEDEDERELEKLQFYLLSILRSLTFYVPYDIDTLKNSEFIQDIINIYSSSLALLVEEEKQIEKNPEYEFTWKEEQWVLQCPELIQGHKMTFGEMIDSKQVVQDMVNLGKSRWECLLPLCAIFLRREGEEYQEHFTYPNSERLKLMEDLPMDIALHVGFFLINSLTLYRTIFLSSHQVEQNRNQEIIQKNTLLDLVG